MIVPSRIGDRWLLRWHDEGVLREVEAREFRRSWTQYDPELHDRQRVGVKRRKGLSR